MARGFSQESLGKSLGLTFQQVQKYEQGTNRVSAGRLYEIALLLEIDVSRFFEGLDRDTPARPPSCPADDEASRLFGLVSQIGNSKIRKHLLDLIAALAAESAKPRSATRRARSAS
jgi:transcriptional regulator with XRE-family HTH domain